MQDPKSKRGGHASIWGLASTLFAVAVEDWISASRLPRKLLSSRWSPHQAPQCQGVEFYSNTEIMAWSWSSVHTAGSGSPWDTKFPILLLQHSRFQSKQARDGVFRALAEFIGWEMEVLQTGVMPSTGFDNEPFDPKSFRGELAGTPIAEGGFFGAFAGIKGDRKSRKENHLFARNWNSTFICDRCLAVQPYKHGPEELSYGDCCEGALWLKTFISHEVYLATERFFMQTGVRQTNSRPASGIHGSAQKQKTVVRTGKFRTQPLLFAPRRIATGSLRPRIQEVARELGVGEVVEAESCL
jgi:hypothetical protein